MDIAKLLAVLEQKGLHVHTLVVEDRKAIGTLAAHDLRHTHYIMDSNGQVVHCGTPATIERFAYQHKESQPK